jgi:ANTAR domain
LQSATRDHIAATIAEIVSAAVAEIAENRAVIDQAKGMLILLYGVDDDTAFDTLRWHSQNTNIKLRALAEQLVSNYRALCNGNPRRLVIVSLSDEGGALSQQGVPRLQLGHRLSPWLGELFRRPPGSGSVWSAAVRLMANVNVGHCWRSRAETCAIRSSTICSPTCAATATLGSLPGCGRCADKFDLPYTTGSPLGQYLQGHRSRR